MTGWLVWLWIKLLYVISVTENGTSRYHLVVFSIDMAFACHFVDPHYLPLSIPKGVLAVVATLVKKYLKLWEFQLATHPFNSWCIDRL